MLGVKILWLCNCLSLTIALKCYSGSIVSKVGQINFDPLSEIECTSADQVCVQKFLYDGDTLIFENSCESNVICNAIFVDDTKISCCNSDLCNNATIVGSTRHKFPENFTLGVASAAYQIEGGAWIDGKGPQIWDFFTQRPGSTWYNSTGDIACDSYHKYQEDLDNLAYLKVNHYRFSFSWSRMLPDGTLKNINQIGVNYYMNIVDGLIARNIIPVVTLYHWDLPQSLMDKGGWLNRETVEVYANYTRFVFKTFGDKVKHWITINEPLNMCRREYCGMIGADADGEFIPHCAWSQYLAGYHFLLAHSRAAEIYHTEMNGTQYGNGMIGISLDGPWFLPASDSQEDQKAAKRAWDFFYGWFAHPIFLGDYPEIMIERIMNRSLVERRNTTRLPLFTDDEKAKLKGSADFLGINYYGASLARARKDTEYNYVDEQVQQDAGIFQLDDEDWMVEFGPDGWARYTPWTLRDMLLHYKNNYGNPKILITENGCMAPPQNDSLEDYPRIHYLRGHMVAIAQAIEQGVNMIGYTIWAFMDDFEWGAGYIPKFGLYHVNFTSPNRTRTPKLSANFYKQVLADRFIDSY